MLGDRNANSTQPHLFTLIPFSDVIRVAVPMGTDIAAGRVQVQRLPASGSTFTGEALLAALQQLRYADAPAKTVVLMTDGKPDGGMRKEEILARVAPKFRAAHIPIMAIGVGDPDNLDATFLRDLASATGGQYIYAGDRYSLDNGFLDSFHVSLGAVLSTLDGRVQEGDTVIAGTFPVTADMSADITLNWPGSDMDLLLVDPRGRIVGDRYAGAYWESKGRPRHLIVDHPMHGTWTVRVQGRTIANGGEPFHVTVSAQAPPRVPSPVGALAWIFGMLGAAVLAIQLRRSPPASASVAP